MPTVKQYQQDPIHEDIRMFETELRNRFPDLVVTSGFRPNARTKQGNVSRHSKGEAIDIRYNKEINDYLWNTKEGISLLNKYNLGFLDESDARTMKRTGATGKHAHIGLDSTLVPRTRQRYKELWGSDYSNDNVDTQATDFENTDVLGKFGQSPVQHTRIGTGLPTVEQAVEQETRPEKKEDTSKEKEALLQKQREFQFLQDYIGGTIEREVPKQQSRQQMEAPEAMDVLGEYGQISEFVDNPVLEEGGIIKDNKGYLNPNNIGKIVEIQGNIMSTKGYGNIPLYVVPDVGKPRIVYPNTGEHIFDGATKFVEYPIKNNIKNG